MSRLRVMVPVFMLTALLCVCVMPAKSYGGCSMFFEDFYITPSHTWTNANGSWFLGLKGGNYVESITANKMAYSETAFMPSDHFVLDVDVDPIVLNTGGAYGIRPFVSGGSVLFPPVNGKTLDGVGVILFQSGNAYLTGLESATGSWYNFAKYAVTGQVTSIGVEYTADAITLRVNKQNTSSKVVGNFGLAYTLINKLRLSAQGADTVVGFKNVCAGPVGAAPSVPAAPANLRYTLNGTMLTINWDASAGATGYKLGLGAGSKSNWADYNIGNITQIGPFDASVIPGTYYLAVKAYNGSGDSGYSNEITIVIPGQAGLQAPKNLRYSRNNNLLTVKWDAVSGAAGYKMAIGSASGSYFGQYDLGNTTQLGPVDLSGVIPPVNFYVVVSAYGGGAQSGYSNEIGVILGVGVTSAVGTSGGTLSTGNISVVLPSGSVGGGADVSLIEGGNISQEFPTGQVVSKTYTVELSGAVSSPIQLAMKLDRAVSGNVYAVVSADKYNFFDAASFVSGRLYKAAVSGDTATVTIPSAGTAADIPAYTISSQAARDRSPYKFTVHFLFFDYENVYIESAHFRLYYPYLECNRTVMEQWIGFAEDAYSRLVGVIGFDPTGLPSLMDLKVKTLASGRYGEAGYGYSALLAGTWSLEIALNRSYCKDATANSEMKATIGHEFFHTLQYVYDPSWAVTESLGDISSYTRSKFAWFYDTSSAWFEGEMLGNPAYFGSAYSGTEYFINSGLEVGGQSDPQDHGYGSSLFLRHLTAKYDNGILLSIWHAIKGGNETYPTTAMETANIRLADEWKAFSEQFLTGTTQFAGWPLPAQNVSAIFKPDTHKWETAVDLLPLSAKKISFAFSKDRTSAEDLLVKVDAGGASQISAVIYNGLTKLADIPEKGYILKAEPGKTYSLILINNDNVSYDYQVNVKVSVGNQPKGYSAKYSMTLLAQGPEDKCYWGKDPVPFQNVTASVSQLTWNGTSFTGTFDGPGEYGATKHVEVAGQAGADMKTLTASTLKIVTKSASSNPSAPNSNARGETTMSMTLDLPLTSVSADGKSFVYSASGNDLKTRIKTVSWDYVLDYYNAGVKYVCNRTIVDYGAADNAPSVQIILSQQ